jgi:hypothetical protein
MWEFVVVSYSNHPAEHSREDFLLSNEPSAHPITVPASIPEINHVMSVQLPGKKIDAHIHSPPHECSRSQTVDIGGVSVVKGGPGIGLRMIDRPAQYVWVIDAG